MSHNPIACFLLAIDAILTRHHANNELFLPFLPCSVLADFYLQGTILTNLTMLADLSHLDLRNNSLAGEISNVDFLIRTASASASASCARLWLKIRLVTQSCVDEVLQAACASEALRKARMLPAPSSLFPI